LEPVGISTYNSLFENVVLAVKNFAKTTMAAIRNNPVASMSRDFNFLFKIK
jgi:hypothetical protein